MKTTVTLISAALFLLAATATAQVANKFKTKIVVEAVAAENYPKSAPAFVIYPEGENLEILRQSEAIPPLEKALEKLGYSLVKEESQAAVFIRVAYSELEPYATDIQYRNRPTLDYSNSPSTANYAAMIGGGRYKQLANPTRNREQNNVEAILGPNGEPMNLADQEDRQTKIIKSKEETLSATIYPISLEVSAWKIDQDQLELSPEQLWAVRASYNNLRDEETQPQLFDLGKTVNRFLGKNLKKEKLVSRK